MIKTIRVEKYYEHSASNLLIPLHIKEDFSIIGDNVALRSLNKSTKGKLSRFHNKIRKVGGNKGGRIHSINLTHDGRDLTVFIIYISKRWGGFLETKEWRNLLINADSFFIGIGCGTVSIPFSLFSQGIIYGGVQLYHSISDTLLYSGINYELLLTPGEYNRIVGDETGEGYIKSEKRIRDIADRCYRILPKLTNNQYTMFLASLFYIYSYEDEYFYPAYPDSDLIVELLSNERSKEVVEVAREYLYPYIFEDCKNTEGLRRYKDRSLLRPENEDINIISKLINCIEYTTNLKGEAISVHECITTICREAPDEYDKSTLKRRFSERLESDMKYLEHKGVL